MKTKILSGLLSIILVLSMVQISAMAETIYSGSETPEVKGAMTAR